MLKVTVFAVVVSLTAVLINSQTQQSKLSIQSSVNVTNYNHSQLQVRIVIGINNWLNISKV